ncbi:uncharacterized protein BDR25DRAFT_237244 [Lindgomyces ingoldianus]|uniref:Uncharacterized protein n=1 Tax=Lindgomyces ingoldianus TaxID=673940 RepID=A0ACB6QK15_9PLEO|nr:uncharacterized protein BDR25DRAFT_237244 [Lindgomyces ingoldianus]KAF2466476.1 hypothetical protein BDR25DRAFT_237244 [Lindgomyces ingoldianus]
MFGVPNGPEVSSRDKAKASLGARSSSKQHTIVPWIETPLKGAAGSDDDMIFVQRHEASPLELFFDLIFVANLATFTSYHSINDARALFSYIGFFSIIWSSWFQITLHDVRFARDSVYERACKMAQFVIFVGFALVGSGFNPADDPTDMFQILSITLLLLRVLLITQYAVVLVWVHKKGYHRLYLPLFLNILVYAVTASVFAVTATAFTSRPGPAMYSTGYLILLLEGLGTVSISCSWRMVSFKKTHLAERMGLLTLIVIGEGAIGVTKTIGKLLGKGQDLQMSGLIFCIVLVLFLIWMLYFDNRPHGEFGTIRQQIWSIMHFPLHLSIVGAVEGSQQMALARYVLMQSNAFNYTIFKNCMDLHLDGAALVEILGKEIKPFKFDKKAESSRFASNIQTQLYTIGNSTGICTSTDIPEFMEMYKTGTFPGPLVNLYDSVLSALYSSVSITKPKDMEVVETAYNAWQVVYNYYWTSTALIFCCLVVFHVIMRRDIRSDVYHLFAIAARMLAAFIPLSFIIAAARNHAWMYVFIGSAAVIPCVMCLHLAIVLGDRLSGIWANERVWGGARRSIAWPITFYQEHSEKDSLEAKEDEEDDKCIKRRGRVFVKEIV